MLLIPWRLQAVRRKWIINEGNTDRQERQGHDKKLPEKEEAFRQLREDYSCSS